MRLHCGVDVSGRRRVENPRLLNHQRAASSSRDHESRGVTVETEVLVLDSVDGSCCRATRVIPSKASTFCCPNHRAERSGMSSHEAQMEHLYGKVQIRALRKLRKRRFDKDADLHGLVVVWLTMALLCEDHLERQFDRHMDYCRAEGIDQPYDFLKGMLAAKQAEVRHA